MQNFKPSVNRKIKERYLHKIKNLREEIIYRFNDDFSDGVIINSKWLKTVVQNFQKRPNKDKLQETFFKEFVLEYIKEAKSRINPKTGKKLSEGTIKLYKSVLNRVLHYEDVKKLRLRLDDVNFGFHRDYTEHLKSDLKYGNNYIHKNISQIKTFITEATEKGYNTSNDVNSKKFTFAKEETIDTYLNEKEINTVYQFDFSNNSRLDNVRDLFIIGLWTGLRISDLKRIAEFHITTNTILIAGTEKTDDIVEIPIHPQVKEILKKRKSKLPKIISDQKFNNYVKEVCLEVGFIDKILGKLRNPKTNRKEKGYFEKYKLISSHTCRRSFATNHYGKLPDKTIMAITTHKSHSQFLDYIKTTKKEHVERLAEYWENNY